jgi:hypothetical protein
VCSPRVRLTSHKSAEREREREREREITRGCFQRGPYEGLGERLKFVYREVSVGDSHGRFVFEEYLNV